MTTIEKKTVSQKYLVLSDIEHVLKRPGMYVGNPDVQTDAMWIAVPRTNTTTIVSGDDDTQSVSSKQSKTKEPIYQYQIVQKQIEYSPAMYKIFDEILINSRDHVIRMKQSTLPDKKLVTTISVSVDATGLITVFNDGDGIEIERHEEQNAYLPEVIFGRLRSGANFDDEDAEKKGEMLGGQNGYGAKLAFIWGTHGQVETLDHRQHKKYVQDFNDNLTNIQPPIITSVSKTAKPYTKISFRPDFVKFKQQGFTTDFIALLHKRTLDLCGVTDEKTKISFSSYLDTIPQTLQIKSFTKYVDLYTEQKRVHESPNEQWEYVITMSNTDSFQHVSFVNGICTYQGGTHVRYIIDRLCSKLSEYIEKKKKIVVATNTIKQQLFLFLRCDIMKPRFNSQTKECLETQVSKFGSSCIISDVFVEKVAKLGVMDRACAITKVKEDAKIARTTDGKQGKIPKIEKYEHANYAGTKSKSKLCSLILCEGDSAKTGVISGLSQDDRNYYGIYPLKGKVMNVREKSASDIYGNKEITDIKSILGLENGRVYKSVEDIYAYMNYGRIIIMTDADVDGSHIKGLLVNVFACEWSSLIKIRGFLSYMNTPILKASKGGKSISFYNNGEFDKWKNTTANSNTWKLKYFKGLGTSTATEFKEYFREKKFVDYVYSGGKSDEILDLAFNKERANHRKEWLNTYDKNAYIDTNLLGITYEEFVNKELIEFSIQDCIRSIPNIIDGLKESQRKILYSAFKRNLKEEIKVAQFSGYVSEHSAYHHGEVSLQEAIINMAQDYVGSNNINLLYPSGQFGTRLTGGKDSASPRYIYTRLQDIARYIFIKEDDPILTYMLDDGVQIEPEYYLPIIPMVLINESSGIGTGYSTNIPSFSPPEIIDYLLQLLEPNTEQKETPLFMPYYEGFTGTIEPVDESKFIIKGTYTKQDKNTIHITELPVGVWTQKAKEYYESLADTSLKTKTGESIPVTLSSVKLNNDDRHINMLLTFPEGKLETIPITELEKILKINTTVTITNIHAFDSKMKLRKYDTVLQIIHDYFPIRIDGYCRRKAHILSQLEKEMIILENKVRYIEELIAGTLDLRMKSNDVIHNLLIEKKYIFDPFQTNDSYDYLLDMKTSSVSKENVEKLRSHHKTKQGEIDYLVNSTPEQLWKCELLELRNQYVKWRVNFTNEQKETDTISKKIKK